MYRLPLVLFLLFLLGCQDGGGISGKADHGLIISSLTHPNKIEILTLAKNQQFDQLETYFTNLYQAFDDKQIPEDWLRQAHHAFYNSDPDIQQYLDAWVDQSPSSYFAVLNRGIYWMRLAQLSRGANYINKTQERQKLGMRYYQETALVDLHKAAELSPKAFLPYSYIMSISKTSGDNTLYISARSEGLKLFPESFILRSEVFFGLQPKWGGTKDALDLFLEETARHSVTNPELRSLLGYKALIAADAMKNDDRDAAIALFHEAIGFGGNEFMYLSRGKNYYYKRDYELALKDLNKALSFYPQHYLSLRFKAWTLYHLKRYEEAISVFKLAVEIDKLAPNVNYGLAYTLSSQGRQKESVYYYEAAVKHYGAYQSKTLSNYGYMLLWKLKDYKRAAEILKRTTEVAPENTFAWYNFGVALNYLRDCDAISVHKTYLRLCEGANTCSKKNIEWAQKNSAYLINGGTCKDQPMFLF